MATESREPRPWFPLSSSDVWVDLKYKY
uniref:Uncharacterized protein n=1 Tax=Arundo donax TaxID=35708 RepID=A0A0A8Y7B3_ARUDO